ncbi:hypothetical protein FSP39_022770 [Pinctada imbricata]|uniref:Hexosyltransferase n=1 Tax=Pinctada imbricata TaxID=66713 RepID=A0AA88YH12_PINIB|nr:hypothetical protein FSP39_022770 [Pinctada imbricata]
MENTMSRRWTLLVRKCVVLFPVFVYITLLGYQRLRLPWCEELRENYPMKIDFTRMREGKTHNEVKPLNTQSFKYIHNPIKTCANDRIEILSVVKSIPGNVKLRNAIRQTWGRATSTGRNRLLFSLGKVKDKNVQEQIDAEVETFHDILQGDFEDSYLNLTQKTIHGFHWISKYCAEASFVFFVDDDVIVNFKNLISTLHKTSHMERENLFTGYVVTNPGPTRWGSKFTIFRDYYPFPCFPYYVSGPAVLTTGKVVKMFDAAIPYVRNFMFEDVYLGLVAMKLGLTLSPTYNYLFDHDGSRLYKLPCMISSHQGGGITADTYTNYYNDFAMQHC